MRWEYVLVVGEREKETYREKERSSSSFVEPCFAGGHSSCARRAQASLALCFVASHPIQTHSFKVESPSSPPEELKVKSQRRRVDLWVVYNLMNRPKMSPLPQISFKSSRDVFTNKSAQTKLRLRE